MLEEQKDDRKPRETAHYCAAFVWLSVFLTVRSLFILKTKTFSTVTQPLSLLSCNKHLYHFMEDMFFYL